MNNDKLKKKGIHFFIIPFMIFLLIFSLSTYLIVDREIKDLYEDALETTLNLADSYSKKLASSETAKDIIDDLLDEKMLVAVRAVAMAGNDLIDRDLEELAEELLIDEIYLYNKNGEIVHSNINRYIGWKAYEGHPVYNFMTGDKKTFVEDIRSDTESGISYKYAYIMKENGSFIQVGVLAQNIYRFYESFEIQQLINEIVSYNDVEDAFYSDRDFKIVAGSIDELTGDIISNEYVRDHLMDGIADAEVLDFYGRNVLHACAPVIYEDQIDGMLSVVWSADNLEKEIRNTVLLSLMILILVVLTTGGILYYAYKKNSENAIIAYYDKLTGLPNKEYLDEYLEESIRNRDNIRKAIILVNISNLKILNMSYGFAYGDNILKKAALDLSDAIKGNDRLFRFNADRYIIVVNGFHDRNDLKCITEKISNVFENKGKNKMEQINVTAHISVVEFPEDDFSPDLALKYATLALTHIKDQSGEMIVYFDSEMEKQLIRKDLVERTLREVIRGEDTHSFNLVFQPKLDIGKNIIIGYEALARLAVEGLGNISPVEFIELAEKRMIIYELGNHILIKACEFLKILTQKGFANVGVAVNISYIQLLRDEFVEKVNEIIKQYDVDVKNLEFEITESIPIENFDLVNEKLERIREMGITISLDDFGTGFSSFARLNDLNIDAVKIDKHFIRQINNKEKNLIIDDIISMSHKMDLKVVSEGVEEPEQYKYLMERGCDIVQGYFVSKPLPEADALDLLKGKVDI